MSKLTNTTRIAFAVNALAGDELRAGKRDVSRIFTLLTDQNLGMCDPKLSRPINDCENKATFLGYLTSTLASWRTTDQLILYYSGHGEVRRDLYCLKLGTSDSDFFPFESLMNELKANGVSRAILIIDACHSGAAAGMKSTNDYVGVITQQRIPQGVAILASSRASEISRELPDGSASVFTHLFCEGIETGLNGKRTDSGLIRIGDIVSYINGKLDSEKQYSTFSQRPRFKINDADSDLWIAKNKSGSLVEHNRIRARRAVKSLDELELLYKQTVSTLHPCNSTTLDELDWKLVERYSDKVYPGLFASSSRAEVLTRLQLYSPIPYQGNRVLHKSAVLCFSKRPEIFYPQAGTVFVVLDKIGEEFVRRDVGGPLSQQVTDLIELTKTHLESLSFIAENGLRREIEEFNTPILRELISNAITHRDYDSNGKVQVRITPEFLEILNPGRFPEGTSWNDFINSPPVSCPINAAIAQYLTNLLAFEGIGRGFDLFRKFIVENGSESIRCLEAIGPTTIIQVKRFRRIDIKFKPKKEKKKSLKVFTFGNIGVGKSTLIASLAYYLTKSDKILFRYNIANEVGKTVLVRDWLGRLAEGKFPPRTPKGEIVEVDVSIEQFDDEIETLGLTFFELSGEDLREIDATNFSGKFDVTIENTIKSTDIFFVVVPCDCASIQDLLVSQFFETIIGFEKYCPTAVILSKWDMLESPPTSESSFIKTNMPLTHQWLVSGRFPESAVFSFSVGVVSDENDGRSTIKEFNAKNAERIVEWLYKTQN